MMMTVPGSTGIHFVCRNQSSNMTRALGVFERYCWIQIYTWTLSDPVLKFSLRSSADTGIRERVIEKEVPVQVPAAPRETQFVSHIPDRSEEHTFTDNPPAPVHVSAALHE